MQELVADIRQTLGFMKKTGVRLRFFIVSLAFSLGLTLFNLYTVSLLFPLVQGIIKSDFAHVSRIKGLDAIVRLHPETFSSSISLFMLLVAWIYLTIIIKNVLHYAATVSTDYQAKQATIRLRSMLFDRCLSFGKSFFDRNKVMAVHRTLTTSTRVIEKQFSLLKNLIINLCLLAVFAVMMVRISWQLTLVSLAIFPVINHLTRRIMKNVRDSLRDSEEAEEGLNGMVLDTLNCLPLIKGFAQEEKERALFNLKSRAEIDKSFETKKRASLLPPIEDIGSTTTMLLLAFGMAFVIHLTGSLDPSGAFVFFYLAQKLVPTLGSLNDFTHGMLKSRKERSEIDDMLGQNDARMIREGTRGFDGLKRGIEFRDLSFTYAGKKTPVLRGLSLTIPKGKMTAIVGPTGSGKSTIANLLLRFYDVDPGTILVDGIDIREFRFEALRNRMSFVGQDHLLFNDTVGRNISYGAPADANDERVRDVAQRTAVHDFVDAMPDKYETVIGEKGANLSGGERQRLSMARALLRDHDILILDEATSALDAGTEDRVMTALRELSPGTTRIVISHRLSTIRDADQIVFVEDGEVRESGTFDEMLALRGAFHRHWALQKLG